MTYTDRRSRGACRSLVRRASDRRRSAPRPCPDGRTEAERGCQSGRWGVSQTTPNTELTSRPETVGRDMTPTPSRFDYRVVYPKMPLQSLETQVTPKLSASHKPPPLRNSPSMRELPMINNHDRPYLLRDVLRFAVSALRQYTNSPPAMTRLSTVIASPTITTPSTAFAHRPLQLVPTRSATDANRAAKIRIARAPSKKGQARSSSGAGIPIA